MSSLTRRWKVTILSALGIAVVDAAFLAALYWDNIKEVL